MSFSKNLNKLLLLGAVLVGGSMIVKSAELSSPIFSKSDLYIGDKLYTLVPKADPIDFYKDLSPKSKYESACKLLSESDKFDKILGARLILSLIKDNDTTAISFLDFTCDIQDDYRNYSESELINTIIRKFN